jgi:hypothetical protein
MGSTQSIAPDDVVGRIDDCIAVKVALDRSDGVDRRVRFVAGERDPALRHDA